MPHKTYSTKPTDIEQEWWLVDAEGQTLGRLATQIAQVLRGKHKPYFAPHLDCGDFVIVVNAEKIAVTGNRLYDKRYYRHTNYPGGLKSLTLEQQLQKHPERVIQSAVKGMLPSNSALGRAMLKKMKVYAGPTHPHEAQNPKTFEIVQTKGKKEN